MKINNFLKFLNKGTYLSLSIFIFMTFSCNFETKKSVIEGTSSMISFKKDLYNFGTIPAKKEAIAIFNFSNTGDNPLIITEVKTTCGCTVPEYPKEPLQPNEKGEIKVIYDAKYPGRFNKTVTVYYNGKDSPKKLTIKGEVPYPKELNSID